MLRAYALRAISRREAHDGKPNRTSEQGRTGRKAPEDEEARAGRTGRSHELHVLLADPLVCVVRVRAFWSHPSAIERGRVVVVRRACSRQGRRRREGVWLWVQAVVSNAFVSGGVGG